VVIVKCPACGGANLVHENRDLTYAYKGESTVIPAVTGDYCPACGEAVFERVHGDRYAECVAAFQRQVNAAYVDPLFIASVRRKLNLDQREAAEIFGGGVNAFSRYENGKTKPSLALVQLLRLLDRHPDLLGEIRAA